MEDLLDENVMTFFNDSLSADEVDLDSLFTDSYALLEQNSAPSNGTITPPLPVPPVPPPAPEAPEPRPSTPATSQPLPSLACFAAPLSEREIHQLRLTLFLQQQQRTQDTVLVCGMSGPSIVRSLTTIQSLQSIH